MVSSSGTVSLSVTPSPPPLLPGRCDVLWSSKMKPVSVLSFLRRRGSQTGCNYFLPGTGSVWRTKCTRNTRVTIGPVCTKYMPRAHTHTHADKHTHDQKRTGVFPQTRTCARAQKQTADEHRHQTSPTFFPPVVLSCCDYSQGEIHLLINATNVVCFLAILNNVVYMGFHAITCCSAFINNLRTRLADTESYIHIVDVCTATSHLTITQHTVGFFPLFAGSKLDGLPYIFSYADGHITGAGIPLKWFVVLIWKW